MGKDQETTSIRNHTRVCPRHTGVAHRTTEPHHPQFCFFEWKTVEACVPTAEQMCTLYSLVLKHIPHVLIGPLHNSMLVSCVEAPGVSTITQYRCSQWYCASRAPVVLLSPWRFFFLVDLSLFGLLLLFVTFTLLVPPHALLSTCFVL